MRILHALLWLSVASGIFLAFAWPSLVSDDPASGAFEAIAKATLAVFFLVLAAILAAKARRGGR